MKVIVVGCGRMGADLAYQLYKGNHIVTVVDKDLGSFNKLPPDFRGRMIEGDALNQDVLLRAGIQSADALTSLTDLDSVNMVVGHIAHHIFQIANVVVRNNYSNSRPFYETFNLQVVSPLNWGAQRVEEMLQHTDIQAVFSAGNGEVEVYEILLPDHWTGSTMEKLFNDQQCQLVAVTRGGKAFLPSLDLELNTGDMIHISTTNDGIKAIREKISRNPIEGAA